ncbi:MAG: FCD domain-containing protein [Rhodobacterales bacterium]|nr:FCD domain-containing protein [Rhodobacterales bacterium]
MNNLARSADDLASARNNAKTLVEYAYRMIREDILSAKLKPGSRLRVEHMRTEYDVGSSTLREALSLLVADRLVVSVGQRGFRVAPISLADIQDIMDLRKVLETRALRESIQLGTDEWEASVVAAFHRLSKVEERIDGQMTPELVDQWEACNNAFHDALISHSSSPWLLHFRDVLYHQSERYRRMALVDRTVPRDVHQEHADIKDAALDRDADAACRLTEEHIDRTLSVMSNIAALAEDADADA